MNEKGTAVVVYQSSGQIFYIVGCLTDRRLDWGRPLLIGEGCNVQAAINKHNEVVIVYSENRWRVCHYRGGIVQQSDKTIQWWEEASCKLANGTNPTVALKDRTVIFIHEADYWTYRAFYRIGEIRASKIWMTDEHRLEALDWCKEISVAVNGSKVLLACRTVVGSDLYYSLGELDGSVLRNITKPQLYGTGYYNHVSLVNNDCAVAVHESSAPFSKGVMLKTGKIVNEQNPNTITWKNDREIEESAFRISAAVNSKNKLIVVFKQNATGYGEGVLMYKFGSLIESNQ